MSYVPGQTDRQTDRQSYWLPSKLKITLANLAKVDKFLLAKEIFF